VALGLETLQIVSEALVLVMVSHNLNGSSFHS
jgi:hypothetical protein